MTIGIDVSTKDVAVVFCEGEIVKDFKIGFYKDSNIGHKCFLIRENLWEMMVEKLPSLLPTLLPKVYIEKPFAPYGKMASKTINSGVYEILGAILTVFPNAVYLNSSQWKKALKYPQNKGLSAKQKAQMAIDFVKDNFGVEFTDNDLAEAYMIAKAGEMIYG